MESENTLNFTFNNTAIARSASGKRKKYLA